MSKLSDECEMIYIQEGQFAVFDYVMSKYPKTPWAWCEPCNSRSPRDTDYACLVCGSPTQTYNFQDER